MNILIAAIAVLLLGGQAAPAETPKLGSELVGRTVRAEAPNGEVSTVRFMADGTVEARDGEQTVTGRWVVANNQICFDWPETERECWPYDAPMVPGVTVTSTSDKGTTTKVTLE